MNIPRLKVNVYDTFVDVFKENILWKHIKLSQEDKDRLRKDLYYAILLAECSDKVVSYVNDYRTSSK